MFLGGTRLDAARHSSLPSFSCIIYGLKFVWHRIVNEEPYLWQRMSNKYFYFYFYFISLLASCVVVCAEED